MIPIAFLNGIKSPTLVNFASASERCTTFPGSRLQRCPEIEEDIAACQAAGKTLLLSLGGATYTEGGFSGAEEAVAWADNVWAMFGPPQEGASVNRPFGNAVVDGFDFDFESPTQNMAPFATRLRELIDASAASSDRRYYLAAAPQCPFPDVAMNDILQAVPLDFVMVQFYNNHCGATSFTPRGGSFNFRTWDAWARSSPNPSAKVLVGVPGTPSAAGTGYVSGDQLQAIIAYSRQYSSFGGVMVWDMSQLLSNLALLESMTAVLGGNISVPRDPTTFLTSVRAPPSALSSSAVAISTAAVSTLLSKPSPVTVVIETVYVCATPRTSSQPSAFTSTVYKCGPSASPLPPSPTSKPSSALVENLTSAKTSTLVVSPPGSSTGPAVGQWGQCGGRGYTGPTSCQPPFTCVQVGEWWAHCI